MSAVFQQDVSDLIGAGLQQQQLGRLDQAERLFNAAARVAPDNWEPAFRLAMIELHRGEARRALGRLLALGGSAAPAGELHHLIGRAYKALGEIDRALEHFERAIEGDPALAAARVSLGLLQKRQGRLDDAHASFARAAADNPQLAEAHINLGALLRERGEPAAARAALARGVELWPGSAQGWYWLGEANAALGDASAAAAAFGRAEQIDPSLGKAARAPAASAWASSGDELRARGDTKGAIDAYRRALALDGQRPEVLNNLGVLLLDTGQRVEGLAVLRRAAELDPNSAETLGNLGIALLAEEEAASALSARATLERAVELHPEALPLRTSLARARLTCGDLEGALSAARHVLEADAAHAAARIIAGQALQALCRWDEAERELLRAIEGEPQGYEGHLMLGSMLIDCGRFIEGEARMRKAAELEPQSAEIRSNHGVSLYLSQRPQDAIDRFDRVIEEKPEHYPTHLWRSMCYLMLGDLRRGFAEFEWRWRGFEQLRRSQFQFVAPRWAGEPLRGRTILLHGEQGMGDVLQFARFAPLLAERGARVWLFVHAPLARLLRSVPGVDRVFRFDESLPAFDVHCPLMSLPHTLGTGLADLPGPMPYLQAPKKEVERWRERLAGEPKLRVGLVWSGDPRKNDRGANLTDSRRSVKLAQLAPLARVPGVRWFSLQKGEPSAQAANPPEGMKLVDWSAELKDFTDTAALVANLDLVISVDTSVVHLVGGMGKPIWMLSRFDGCWRWLQERSDSPWYPSMRIFRQDVALDWRNAIESLAAVLEERVASGK